MWRPHKGICICHNKENIIVVKAGFCKIGNDAQKRAKKGLPTKRPPLNKRSEKREKLDALYSIVSKQYLKDHPKCEFKIEGICTHTATSVHHGKGRTGALLLDTKYFKSGCLPCHSYVELHPVEAKEKGFSVTRLNK
jgi:hypothetical protein